MIRLGRHCFYCSLVTGDLIQRVKDAMYDNSCHCTCTVYGQCAVDVTSLYDVFRSIVLYLVVISPPENRFRRAMLRTGQRLRATDFHQRTVASSVHA